MLTMSNLSPTREVRRAEIHGSPTVSVTLGVLLDSILTACCVHVLCTVYTARAEQHST